MVIQNFEDVEIKNSPIPAFLSESSDYQESSLGEDEVGRSFYLLGKIHYDKSDLNKAEDNFIQSLKFAERPRDNFSMFKALGFLIRIASEKLEDEKAKGHIDTAEELLEELARSLGSLNTEYFYNAGIVANYKGDFQFAKDNFQLAYKKSKEENEPELLAKCLLALATNEYYIKNFESSLRYLDQLGQLLKIIDKSYLCGSMYLFYGKVFLELEEYEKSLNSFKKANIFLQDKKCWNLFGYLLMRRGMVYKRMGDFNKSLTFYQLALESIDKSAFRRLVEIINLEIEDVNDSNVDIYLDRNDRRIVEKIIGVVDFKHRFVLLEILFLLAKNIGVFYDKEQLAKSIWKDEYNPLIHDKLIYTSVSRLRKLIEPKNQKGYKRKYIIRGKDGYTFNPDVKVRFQNGNRQVCEHSIANVELSSPV